jgi:hypothetical protein
MSSAPARPAFNDRKSSLRIPNTPTDAPVPPSLLAKAPHLASPNTVLRRGAVDPKAPSREDEEWLRDMVPVSEGRSQMGSKVVIVRR